MNYYNDNNASCVKWLKQLINKKLIPDGTVDNRSISDIQPKDIEAFDQVHFFAGIGGWSRALFLSGWKGKVWTGSCPCFPAGTLVITSKGFKPIEEIKIGDMVLTHKLRFKRVQATGSEFSKCVFIKGQGHFGLTCTPNHPFLSDEETWTEARFLKGKRWANIIKIPFAPIPEVKNVSSGYFFDKSLNIYKVKGEKNKKSIYIGSFKNEEDAKRARSNAIYDQKIDTRGANAIDIKSLGFAKFLGYWLGDGWTSKNSICLCGSKEDIPLLNEIFANAKLKGNAYLEKTSSRIRCMSIGLSNWLKEQFGEDCYSKKIPIWLYGMPKEYIQEFINGYVLADGHEEIQKNGKKIKTITTVSKFLAIGIRILFNQMGMSASIQVRKGNNTCIIEGRIVSKVDCYKITAYNSYRSFKFNKNYGWGLVRSVKPTNNDIVYNLAVEEDESYTADGIVVHNCQPFSIAGKLNGSKDKRHLWPEMFRLIRELKPSTVFGEQVSSPLGRTWLASVLSDLEEAEYNTAAADLCGPCVGSPHIRQRLYWLADTKYNGLYKQKISQAEQNSDGTKGRIHNGNNKAVGDSDGQGLERRKLPECKHSDQLHTSKTSYWNASEPFVCGDGNIRPIEPGLKPLVDGIPQRVELIQGYGNAIIPQVAAEFISSYLECISPK